MDDAPNIGGGRAEKEAALSRLEEGLAAQRETVDRHAAALAAFDALPRATRRKAANKARLAEARM